MKGVYPRVDNWTSTIFARLRQLHDDGLSFSAIALRLNAEFNLQLTRNAVMGKAHRARLAPRAAPPPPPKPRTRPPKPERPARALVTTSRPAALTLPVGPPVGALRTISLGAAGAGAITFEQLTHGVCRWVHGEWPPYLFCGAATHLDSPYCEPHHARVYENPRKRWR